MLDVNLIKSNILLSLTNHYECKIAEECEKQDNPLPTYLKFGFSPQVYNN